MGWQKRSLLSVDAEFQTMAQKCPNSGSPEFSDPHDKQGGSDSSAAFVTEALLQEYYDKGYRVGMDLAKREIARLKADCEAWAQNYAELQAVLCTFAGRLR